MEFFYEAIVGGYLTSGGRRFCSPQYIIKDDGNWEGCVDFVVLDFEAPQRIVIAEVTSAQKIDPVADKTIELIEDGFPKLRAQLVATLGPPIAAWSMIVQLFVRADQKEAMEKASLKNG